MKEKVIQFQTKEKSLNGAKTDPADAAKKEQQPKTTKTVKTTENIIISQQEDPKVSEKVKNIMNQEEKLLSDLARKDLAEEPETEVMDHKKLSDDRRKRDSELLENVSEGLVKISRKEETQKGLEKKNYY